MNRRRGYTLVELAVVTLLTAVLVFGMVRWLVGVGVLARTGIDDAADGRRAAVVAQLRRDVDSAVHCDPRALDARVRELAADRLSIVAQVDADAAFELVSWRLEGSRLERSEVELGADCTGSAAGWAPWADGVESFSLASVVDGEEVSAGTAGACVDSFLLRCQVDAVSVSFTLSGDPATERVVLTLP